MLPPLLPVYLLQAVAVHLAEQVSAFGCEAAWERVARYVFSGARCVAEDAPKVRGTQGLKAKSWSACLGI